MKIFLISFLFSVSCFCGLSDMAIEEKVGQTLMVQFCGEEATEEIRSLVQDSFVGGVIYYQWANGLHSPEQVRSLSTELQKLASQTPQRIPLFLCTDQEGGKVSRLKEGFTSFSGNLSLGKTKNVFLAEKSAYMIGKEMKAAGLNFNLAPVVDINTKPKNPVIGVRSFGESPDEVIRFGSAALQGFHEAGVITSLKHYPGHGSVEIDSHEDLPFLEKTKEEMFQEELLPFKILAQNADTIMTAHIMIPKWDPNMCATLSEPILSTLRNEIGFEGVIVSDSLVMEGVLKNGGGAEEASIKAFLAGCDLLILGGKKLQGTKAGFELDYRQQRNIHQALVQAVKTGVISEKRLDESVTRILRLKEKYELSTYVEEGDLSAQLLTKEAKDVSKQIAEESLKVVRKSPRFDYAVSNRTLIVAPAYIKQDLEEVFSLSAQGVEIFFFEDMEPTDEEIREMERMIQGIDTIIFFSLDAWRYSSQAKALNRLLEKESRCILVALGYPIDQELFPEADLICTTCSCSKASLLAVYRHLKGCFRQKSLL